MPRPSDKDDTSVKAGILKRYPHEPSNLTLAPIRERSRGKVNDEDVDFCYRLERRDYHHTGALYDCLSWQTCQNSNTDDIVTIGVKYIVAIHPIGGRASDKHSLIFVDPLKSKSGGSQTPVLGLRTVTIVNPPEDLVSDFLCPEEPEHLFVGPNSSTPNLRIIVSSGSGIDLASDIWCNHLQPLLEHFSLSQDTDYAVHHTTSETSIAELTASTLLPRAVRGIAQTIILLSGDGGVSDLLNAILSTSPRAATETLATNTNATPFAPGYVKPTLVLLPCGTNNALAHSHFITSNRITKHSTHGLRILLLGTPEPLPCFRATFSPGARLRTPPAQAQDRLVPLSRFPRGENSRGQEQGEADEGLPTLHGAVVASWALHATLTANIASSNTSAPNSLALNQRLNTAAEAALYPTDKDSGPHMYKGKVTLFDAARSLPCGGGSIECEIIPRRELVRREHVFVLATCCAFLEEGCEVSPDSTYGDERMKVVEFGALDAPDAEAEAERGDCDGGGGGGAGGDISAAAEVKREEAPSTRPSDEIMKVIQAFYNRGTHVQDLRIGYHSIKRMKIEINDTENDELQRRFCVDGKIIVVEKGGWMEIEAREPVLDLVAMEWEGSELSLGREEELTRTGSLSFPMELPSEGLEFPVDEVR